MTFEGEANAGFTGPVPTVWRDNEKKVLQLASVGLFGVEGGKRKG